MKKIHTSWLINLALISALTPAIGWAETGTALKADTLRAEPFSDAKTLSTIAKGESVNILSKKGAWLQIKTKKNTGWVRLFSVKRGTVTKSNQVKGVVDVASGRAGTGKVISTTGIRGLNAEELKAAQFNEDEIKKLEGYTQTSADAQVFANAGDLKAIQFNYLKGVK